MARCLIAPAVVEDIESILAWTHEQFGENARLRYEALLIRAMIDIAKQPRHFILYRTGADGAVEVGRVLHDSFDLRRHLPLEFRAQPDEIDDSESE